jgi:acetyl esterase/lipase
MKSGALAAASIALASLAALAVAAQTTPNSIEPDGSVNVPAYRLPPSIYMSDEARKALPRRPSDTGEMLEQFIASGRVAQFRNPTAKAPSAAAKLLADRYSVTLRETTVAGVPGIFVMPAKGVPRGNRGKLLLNLPGGAFIVGSAGSVGMSESIPVAALARVEVLSITYRQAPEAKFPAASEDVAAVYRELLKTHKPKDIALFGCSAGGLLTAQALAWFQKENLPMPGAAGIFCASADARWPGDSWYWQKPLQGLTTPPTLDERFYYGDHDLTDPLMSPIVSPDILRRFPPTLLITGTRAGELSAAVNTHRELIKAGVDADLHVWDGMNHAFFINPDLPESREAYDVMVRFFSRQLHLQQP